jgi:hypothetical protein
LACVVAVAASYAVVAPCLADEEGEGLRVLGDVGDNAVLADAGVCELIRIALVLLGGHGGHAGLLKADEGALRLVLLAPVRCRRLEMCLVKSRANVHTSVRRRHALRINSVGVVVLGLLLGSDKAGGSSNAEGEDGTHGEGLGGVEAGWRKRHWTVGQRRRRRKRSQALLWALTDGIQKGIGASKVGEQSTTDRNAGEGGDCQQRA